MGQDAVAVLDAVGSERAAVVAPWLNGPDGILLAATHPLRVSSLIVVNSTARFMWAPDYPHGFPRMSWARHGGPDRDRRRRAGSRYRGPSQPQRGNGPGISRLVRSLRQSGRHTGHGIRDVDETFKSDVRHLLPHIGVPTLILQGERFFSVAHGRYLADHIPGREVR